MLKKWIALALSLVLMLSALPVSVMAEPETTTAATDPTAAATEPATEPTQPATEPSAPEGEITTPAAPEQTEEKEEEDKPKVTIAPLSPAQAAIPAHKLPTKAARIQRLRYYIQWDYQNAIVEEDAESLKGYCGLLTSYQLYYRGINQWRRSNDGKDYYDTYSVMSVTDGGYSPRAYSALKEPVVEETTQETPAADSGTQESAVTDGSTQEPAAAEPVVQEKITIEQTLNQITNYGTHEVYNLLVCFERTNTEAGTKYGHVVFVYGIIDGIVYFTEGGDMFGVKAGEPMECTISQFAASYDTWTEFEGVVLFGCKDYMDNCAIYACNMFAVCMDSVPLLSLPSQEENALTLRTAAKGERLQVIGLYQNREQQYYYEIDDGGIICYAQAQVLEPILYLHDTFEAVDAQLPQVLTPGKDFRLDGTVQTTNYMTRLCVQVLDGQGQVLQEYTAQVEDSTFDLYDWDLNKALDIAALPEGAYTCRVIADSTYFFLFRGKLARNVKTETVLEQSFCVGEAVPAVAPVVETPKQTVKDGWFYDQGSWYCYDMGTPLTGWQQLDGLQYYLKEDGSVTTGWALVKGQQRLFTATGAMRTGWAESQMGRKYLRQDGTAAHGWLQIDGQYYYFDDFGVLQEDHWGTILDQMTQKSTTPAATEQPTTYSPNEE